MNLASQIESVQPGVFYKLCSEPAFAGLSIFRLREKRLDSQVAAALSGLAVSSQTNLDNVRPGTQAGLSIEVLMPRCSAPLPDTAGPVCTLTQTIHVKEQPTINLGTKGTGITAESAAIMVAQTFQLFSLGFLQSFYTAPNFYRPIDAGPDAPFVLIEVQMQATFALSALTRTLAPAAAYNAGVLTLTDQQPGGGSAIYYTADGSFPGPANPAAILYANPVALASGTTVSAAAYNGALQGSLVDTFNTV